VSKQLLIGAEWWSDFVRVFGAEIFGLDFAL
jgi:hypothetical protein